MGVCVASKCGHWVWSLGGALDGVISGQFVFKLSNLTFLHCFHFFSGTSVSQLIVIRTSHLLFFPKSIFVLLLLHLLHTKSLMDNDDGV